MQARREYLRVVYWGKIARGEKKGLVEDVYREGRKRLEESRATKGEWCKETKEIMERCGLSEYWKEGKVGGAKEWTAVVRKAVSESENMKWRWGMIQGGQKVLGVRIAKVKLGLYLNIKEKLKKEWWLQENRLWVGRWVNLRAGVVKLEVEKGRWEAVARIHRVCKMCGMGEVEDVEHVMDRCPRWDAERKEIWREVGEVEETFEKQAREWSGQERTEWLLRGEGLARLPVLRGVTQMIRTRERVDNVCRLNGEGGSGKTNVCAQSKRRRRTRVDGQTSAKHG
jgi:hypothetical protein